MADRHGLVARGAFKGLRQQASSEAGAPSSCLCVFARNLTGQPPDHSVTPDFQIAISRSSLTSAFVGLPDAVAVTGSSRRFAALSPIGRASGRERGWKSGG